jgi:hypothetical protein
MMQFMVDDPFLSVPFPRESQMNVEDLSFMADKLFMGTTPSTDREKKSSTTSDIPDINLPELNDSMFLMEELPSAFFDDLKMEDIMEMEQELLNSNHIPRKANPSVAEEENSRSSRTSDSTTKVRIDEQEDQFVQPQYDADVVEPTGGAQEQDPTYVSQDSVVQKSKIVRKRRLEAYDDYTEMSNERMFKSLQNYQRTMCIRRKVVS